MSWRTWSQLKNEAQMATNQSDQDHWSIVRSPSRFGIDSVPNVRRVDFVEQWSVVVLNVRDGFVPRCQPESYFVTDLTLHVELEQWPLREPFRVTGYTFSHTETLLVTLARDGHVGLGEASGVYYKNDKPTSMMRQIEALRATIEAGVSRELLQTLLPPGGANGAEIPGQLTWCVSRSRSRHINSIGVGTADGAG